MMYYRTQFTSDGRVILQKKGWFFYHTIIQYYGEWGDTPRYFDSVEAALEWLRESSKWNSN